MDETREVRHFNSCLTEAKYSRATVTHLTPAMGNILAGGATAIFPSLHYAFFVGDVLITRDCRRLQELVRSRLYTLIGSDYR